MTLLLNQDDVRSCTRMSGLIEAIDTALHHEAKGEAEVLSRVAIPAPGNGFLRMMGATIAGQGVLGFKVFNAGGRNGVRYTIGLHDTKSGDQLALMDGSFLTAARTGAVTGIACRLGAPAGTSSVAVIGSGLEARTNLEAVCAALPITRFHAFSPTAENRERFVSEMSSALEVEGRAHADARTCVEQADLVVVATSTRGRDNPIAFHADWMRPGMHICSIGSTHPRGRELDERVFLRVDRLAMDAPVEASQESGDVMAATQAGLDPATIPSLVDVVGRGHALRTSDEQTTCFKSVGTGLQDVAAALAVYRTAVEQGRGTEIDYLATKRSPRSVGSDVGIETLGT